MTSAVDGLPRELRRRGGSSLAHRLRRQPHRAAVDGYEEAKGEAAIGTFAFDKFGNPIGALVEDCRVTPKETLWQKLKKHI